MESTVPDLKMSWSDLNSRLGTQIVVLVMAARVNFLILADIPQHHVYGFTPYHISSLCQMVAHWVLLISLFGY